MNLDNQYEENKDWKEYNDMGNWRIDFVRSIKDKNPKIVTTHNLKQYIVIVIAWLAIMGFGLFYLLGIPNGTSKISSIRLAMFVVSVAISTPWLYLQLPFRTKDKLLRATDNGYYPKSEIDLDRYIIAMNYFKLSDRIPKKILEMNPTFISGYTLKRKSRVKKYSLFGKLFKRRKKRR